LKQYPGILAGPGLRHPKQQVFVAWDGERPGFHKISAPGLESAPELTIARFISGTGWIGDGTNEKTTYQPTLKAMATVCKHPRVRIVSRHEDAEFVECLECGEVFDSEEFHDMEIEDTVEANEAESDY
jgi:hypothetical protein